MPHVCCDQCPIRHAPVERVEADAEPLADTATTDTEGDASDAVPEEERRS